LVSFREKFVDICLPKRRFFLAHAPQNSLLEDLYQLCGTHRTRNRVGITEQAFHRTASSIVGLEIDQVRQLKQPQEESGKLKKLVAELPKIRPEVGGWHSRRHSAPQGIANGESLPANPLTGSGKAP
jgi:hypothetical protein